MRKPKYEQPILVNLNFIDVGYGKCKAGSSDFGDCNTGLSAVKKCKSGGSILSKKCKAGGFVK